VRSLEQSTRWPWSAAVACVVVGVWFAVMVKLAATGFFRTWPGLGPLNSVQVAIVIPPLVIAAAGTLVGPLRAWIRGLDLHFLAGVQVLRILGASHLVSWGAGIMQFVDLPLSVFPTFLIPLFLTIHVVTALRLRGGA
jgi:hypothetical protein